MASTVEKESAEAIKKLVSEQKQGDNVIAFAKDEDELVQQAKVLANEISGKKNATVDDIYNQGEIVLGKIQQIAKDKDNLKDLSIHKLSKKLVEKRLEESMEKELDKLKKNGVITDEDTITKIRAIIRAHKTVSITEDTLLLSAVSQTDKLLKEYIKLATQEVTATSATVQSQISKGFNTVENKADKTFSKINSGFERYTDKFNSYYSDVQSLDKLTETQLSQKIIDDIDDALTTNKGYKNFCTALDKKINSLPILNKLGKRIESNKIFGPMFKAFETKIGSSLSKRLKPVIERHVKQLQKIATVVKKFTEAVKKAEQQFKALLKSYENMALNYAKKVTEDLVNDLKSKVHISFNGGKLSF